MAPTPLCDPQYSRATRGRAGALQLGAGFKRMEKELNLMTRSLREVSSAQGPASSRRLSLVRTDYQYP